MLLDLRGTSCTWDREKIPSSFFPAVEKRLYYPASPLEALSLLLNSQGLIPSSDSGVLHIDRLTHASRERSRDFGNSLPNLDTSPCPPEGPPSIQSPPRLHPLDELPERSSMESGETTLHTLHDVVAAESDAYEARYKAKMFYSQSVVGASSSMAHSPRYMPQWGQELLMLYREPPPWSQAQLPPIVKAASRPRSLENLVPVDRTNERTMKYVQEMRDMLSERHCLVKTETDGSGDSMKASTRLSASRNPFAIRFGESPTPVHERANEETSTPQNADTVTNSTAVTPRSLQSLRPISSIPVPIPPDSSVPVPENKAQDSGSAPSGLRRRHDSKRSCRTVSLQLNGSRDQRSLGRTIGRSGGDRAEPAAARKRTRTAASVSGSKRQGFDWTSWGTHR
jgi:hypothetical protein